MEIIKSIINNKKMIRYFIMAVVIVIIELVVFQLIWMTTVNYYLATVVSFIVGVILNWVVGRLFVFGVSNHHPSREFLMVLVASLVGLSIQIIVVFMSVSVLGLYPIIGKILSIIFSFFWNYWFRARIIYKNN